MKQHRIRQKNSIRAQAVQEILTVVLTEHPTAQMGRTAAMAVMDLER